LAEPLLELYWHIGDTTTRLGRVSPRNVIGENRTLVIFQSFAWRGDGAALAISQKIKRGH
jgi:uncharacterized protein affecting Mg2+/Co2+ transport